MAHRLDLLSTQIASKSTFVQSAFDYLNFASLLTPQQNNIRLKFRQFAEKQVAPHIHPYVDQAKFPQFLLPKLKQLNPIQYFLKAPYGNAASYVGLGSIISQFYRVDAGVGTFILVQGALVCYTIQSLGSQQQKAKYLPKLKSFQMIGGWGLTQQKIGSDASNIETNVTKTANGYKLNGNKRWIGNGNRDLIVVWARNNQNKKVQAFIVQNSTPGVSHNVIKNKLALRIVQNCHITYNNVLISEDTKLPKAVDFAKGTNLILKHSRIYVCWAAVGLMIGVYDNAIKYVTSRKQFGHYIAGYQLIQQKIVKIMATVQAALFSTWRISKLADQDKVGIAQIALVKAWTTERAREVAKWGRQVFGGNGIIHQNFVMKALADAQALYTYEGSYDVNVLVTGRQLTGISAFKK